MPNMLSASLNKAISSFLKKPDLNGSQYQDVNPVSLSEARWFSY